MIIDERTSGEIGKMMETTNNLRESCGLAQKYRFSNRSGNSMQQEESEY